MSRYWKHLRLVEAPYDPPPPPPETPAHESILLALRAENDLRDRLMDGDPPDEVVLVGPESGQIAEIDERGRFDEPTCAWREQENAVQADAAYLAGGIHVFAEIESPSARPDPASEAYAKAGSVVLPPGARIVRLSVPQVFRPVAEELADSYQTPGGVLVWPGADCDYEVVEEEPMVIEGALTPAEVEELRRHVTVGLDFLDEDGCRPLARTLVDDQLGDRYGGPVDLFPFWHDVIERKLWRVNFDGGKVFDLPTNEFSPMANRYHPGSSVPWHVDRNPDVDPVSFSLTTSISLLLSQPGEDFEGGALESPWGEVEADVGDAVIFTAATPHRVAEVTGGVRLAAILFGRCNPWGDGLNFYRPG